MAADDGLETVLLDPFDGQVGIDPFPPTEETLGPDVLRLGYGQDVDRDMAGFAVFFVVIAADGFGADDTQKACFFPCFQKGCLAGCEAVVDLTLRYDPPFSARCGDETHPPFTNRNDCRLAHRLRHPSPLEVPKPLPKHSSVREKGQAR